MPPTTSPGRRRASVERLFSGPTFSAGLPRCDRSYGEPGQFADYQSEQAAADHVAQPVLAEVQTAEGDRTRKRPQKRPPARRGVADHDREEHREGGVTAGKRIGFGGLWQERRQELHVPSDAGWRPQLADRRLDRIDRRDDAKYMASGARPLTRRSRPIRTAAAMAIATATSTRPSNVIADMALSNVLPANGFMAENTALSRSVVSLSTTSRATRANSAVVTITTLMFPRSRISVPP